MSSYLDNDDCTSQVSSALSSIAPSESASQSGSRLSSPFKNKPTVGSLLSRSINNTPTVGSDTTAITQRARSRSVKEQLATIDEGDLPLDASLLPCLFVCLFVVFNAQG